MADYLSSPEVEAKIAAEVARRLAEDALAKQAAATPLPGPLKTAFAIDPSIKVGDWSVRPFYDIDVEILQALNHPLYEMMMASMTGNPVEVTFLPRGPLAWQVSWLLTHTPDDAEEAIKDGTFAEKAKAEFSRLQMGAIVALCRAALEQMQNYGKTLVSYGAPAKEGEATNPPVGQSSATG